MPVLDPNHWWRETRSYYYPLRVSMDGEKPNKGTNFLFHYQKKRINNYEVKLEKPPLRFYLLIIIGVALGILIGKFWL